MTFTHLTDDELVAYIEATEPLDSLAAEMARRYVNLRDWQSDGAPLDAAEEAIEAAISDLQRRTTPPRRGPYKGERNDFVVR
jgi:hypothetical protein